MKKNVTKIQIVTDCALKIPSRRIYNEPAKNNNVYLMYFLHKKNTHMNIHMNMQRFVGVLKLKGSSENENSGVIYSSADGKSGEVRENISFPLTNEADGENKAI